jgi:hypothetical protein
MDLSFANPAGFWALLGLPAVVIIHFLQRRARRHVITTLFLLDPLRQESAGGHRFQRLRTSVPFWLQLLMVLGLTWLLVEPRWVRSTSVQRLAVVLDATASMQPFREAAVAEVSARLNALRPVAATTEYTVLTSGPEEPRLYHGPSATEAVQALAAWQPWLGTHDLTPALRAARSGVGRDGIVLFVSDRPPDGPLPYAARHTLVGSPLDNVGWTGVTVEEAAGSPVIKALARNFGAATATREWWIESPDGGQSPPASLELTAGQSRLLEIGFPAGQDRLILVLRSDRFTADDRLPLVRPAPKSLALQLPGGESPAARAMRDIFAAFPHTRPATNAPTADLTVVGYDPLAPALPAGAACVFAADPQPGATYLTGLVLAEPGPLFDGLNWQGLLVRDTLPLPRLPQDRVLLWQAERPLIAERLSPAGKRQLLFNFDLQTSNARKLPAFAILLHRFLEQLRAETIAPESLLVQTGQKLTLARRTGSEAPPLSLTVQPVAAPPASGEDGSPAPTPTTPPAATPVANPSLLRAPLQPCFFQIAQGPDTLLSAAAYFADPRESDFTAAATADTLADITPVLIEQHSEADTRWRLWVLGLLAALVASWFFTRP